jgi:hypothetical protein
MNRKKVPNKDIGFLTPNALYPNALFGPSKSAGEIDGREEN